MVIIQPLTSHFSIPTHGPFVGFDTISLPLYSRLSMGMKRVIGLIAGSEEGLGNLAANTINMNNIWYL